MLTRLTKVYFVVLFAFHELKETSANDVTSRLRSTKIARVVQEAAPPENDLCEDAILISATTTHNPSTPSVVGSTIGSTAAELSESNGVFPVRHRVFYQFVTRNNARYKLTTCHDETDFDTAIVVSDSLSECIGAGYLKSENDFDCDTLGYASTLEFYAQKDTRYKIAVTSNTAEGVGNFGLTLIEYTLPDNDQCDNATLLQPRQDLTPVIVGSTENATYKEHSWNPAIRDWYLSVIYSVMGTGSRMRISTCSNETDFDSALTVIPEKECDGFGKFRNTRSELYNDHDFDCDALGFGSTIELYSRENVLYKFAVRGVTKDLKGTFGLVVMEYVRPTNDLCSAPIVIEVEAALTLNNSTSNATISQEDSIPVEEDTDEASVAVTRAAPTVHYGSTKNATRTEVPCYDGFYPTVYYTVQGDGRLYRASTCSEQTNFASSIIVHEDICDNNLSRCSSRFSSKAEYDFGCDSTGNAATVEWPTQVGKTYTIAVRGVETTDRGDFGLTVTANGTAIGGGCSWVQECSAP